MQQRESANMVGMSVRHEDGPDVLSFKLGKIGQGVCLVIHTDSCIDNKPLFGEFNSKTRGTNAARSA
jgi:hypothetical protein